MTVSDVLNGIRTGSFDAKQEVLKMLAVMTPAQRKSVEAILPQVEQIARQAGLDVGDFKQEVGAHLT